MKKLISLLTATAMLLTMSMPIAFAAERVIIFNDIGNHAWAKPAIEAFVANGSINGTSESTFSPGEVFTREQLAKVISLAFKLNSDDFGFTQSYSDVDSTSWAYPYIESVKEFMPGYSIPGSDKPVFRGAAPATREQIIVTVAKALRTVDISSSEADEILSEFTDSNEISYQLRPKVADMVKKGVITGYNKKLRPQDGLTRAEAITVLYRATLGDVSLKNLVYPNPVTTDKFVLSGETDREARVWVNKVEATVDRDGKFTSKEISVDTTQKEMMVEVKAEKASASNVQNVKIPIQLNAPTINLTSYPTTSTKDTVKIVGNIKDLSNDGLKLFANDESVYLSSNGDFTFEKKLVRGANKITLKAVNKLNLQSVKELSIEYEAGAPTIELITELPKETTKQKITVNGKVTDANKDGMRVFVGEKSLSLDSQGYFSFEATLVGGKNTFTIKAVNKLNLEAKKTIDIELKVTEPSIEFITDIPKVTAKEAIEIKGLVKDLPSNAKLFIDDTNISIDRDGYFKVTLPLREGNNAFKTKLYNGDTLISGTPTIEIELKLKVEEEILPGEDVDKVPEEEKKTEQGGSSPSTLSLENLNFPDKIRFEERYQFSGVVRSNYPIQTLHVSVRNNDGRPEIDKSFNIGSTSYNLNKITNSIYTDGLQPGLQEITIEATDKMGTKVLLNKSIYVYRSSNLRFEGFSFPDKIKFEERYQFSGRISSNYQIQTLRVSVKNDDGRPEIDESFNINSTSYDLSKITNSIYTDGLQPGIQEITIEATDEMQKKVLLNKYFYVQ